MALQAVLALMMVATANAQTPLTFSKAFGPGTIGPGSTTTLTFTITNNSGTPDANLAFTDVLPAGQMIATPASATTDCGPGIVSAPDGGTTISLTGGTIGASPASCTVTVNITGTLSSRNTSGDLTSNAGNSGSATDSLTVDTARPGFSKSFAPNPITPGQTSTLTFTVDNTANASAVSSMSFTDNLPAGMTIASPANAFTDCESAPLSATLTATSGTSVISYFYTGTTSFPAVGAGGTCTVTVDVITTAAGTFDNISSDLTANGQSSGFATDRLTVELATLTKAFTDDPVAPGGTVTLEFTITNLDRDFTATNFAFTDDLNAVLTGLSPTGLPLSVCNGGTLDETSAGSGVLELSGPSSLSPGESCTFSVVLDVPAGAVPDTYTNTTSDIAFDLNGSPTTDGPATDDLVIASVPVFTKEFTDDPVGAGGTVTLEFTIANIDPDAGLDEIAFTDDLDAMLSGITVTALPPGGFCGPGSTMFTTTFPLTLNMTGGSLDPSDGSPGGDDECTFQVTLMVPAGAAPGTYPNTTSDLTAELEDETPMLVPISAPPATDDLVVVAAPTLTKQFTDDPVLPGGTVTLEFTITNPDTNPTDATDIAFTDDLGAVLTGLSPTGLPATVCNGGTLDETSPGSGVLDFSGGTLMPDETCVFSVTLDVPGTALPGTYTNTTSDVTATVSGVTATGNPGQDDLEVGGLTFTKEFTDDPVGPGGTVTLAFTITNLTAFPASSMIFTDNVNAVITGLASTSGTLNDVCGTGSQITGTTFLTFTGGNLDAAGGANDSCTFSVTLAVPGGATAGTYPNTTSNLSASIDGNTVIIDPATDALEVVEDMPPGFLKSFSPDVIDSGDISTLTFTIDNTPNLNDATSLDFTDVMPPEIVVATPSNATTDCTGGTLTATPGTSTIAYSGGSVAAGASCTISVDVTSSTPGTHTNTSGDLTSSLGNSGPATDDLDVLDSPTVTVTKTDATTNPEADPGDTITYTVTISVADRDATNVTFADTVDPNTTLDCTTNPPTTTQGTVTTCDASTGDVAVDVGTITIGGTVTITFEAAVNSPLPANGAIDEVCNQGTASGDNFTDVLSDDPDVGGTEDETCTDLDVPFALLKINEIDYIQPGDEVAEFVEIFNANEVSESLDGFFLQLINGDGGGATVYASIDLSGNTIADFDYFVVCGDAANVENCDLDTSPDMQLIQNGSPDAVALVDDEGWLYDTVSYEGDTGAPYTETTGVGLQDEASGGTGGANENKGISRLPNGDDTDDNATDLALACITPGAENIDTTEGCAPDLVAEKVDTVNDGDGPAFPGDTIGYLVSITNNGGVAHGVTFTDTVDSNTTLDCTTNPPSPSQGTVTTCDESTGDLVVDLGLIPGGATVTVFFEVVVDNPVAAGVDQVCNQGAFSGNNTLPGVTDDPATTGTPDDTTCTVVEAEASVTATKQDVLAVDNNGNGEADPGDTIEYIVIVTNDGDEGASNVIFTDTPGVNTTLVVGSVTTTQGTVVTGNTGGDTEVEVDLTEIDGEPSLLDPLASATVTFRVTIDVPFPASESSVENQGLVTFDEPDEELLQVVTDDPDTPAGGDPTVTPVARSADLALTKDASTPTPEYQSEVTFTIVVTNNGPVEPVGATVKDVLPDGLAYVSHTTTQGIYDTDTGEWDTDALDVGGTATLTITARVETVEPVTNVAAIELASVPDPVEENNSDTATITPIAADLEIDKTVIDFSSDRNGSGPEDDTVTATFKLTVTNNGPSDATGVFVADPVPDGATFVSAAPDQGAYDDVTGTWTIGDLDVGESAMLVVVLTASADNNVFNLAEVFGDQPDQDEDNNIDGAYGQHDRDSTPLFADLSMSKTVDNATPDVGDEVVFTVAVTNNGPDGTAGVVVSEALPAGLEFVSATFTSTAGPCTQCVYFDSLGVWEVGQMPAGSTKQLMLRVRVTGSGEITNTVEVTESHLPDPDSVFGDGDEEDDDLASATINAASGKAASAVRDGAEGIPETVELQHNYPNPFNPETLVPFGLPQAEHVRIEVYNLLGQRVALLVDKQMAAGRHEVVWQATDQPSGMYLVRLRAGSTEKIMRVTLLK